MGLVSYLDIHLAFQACWISTDGAGSLLSPEEPVMGLNADDENWFLDILDAS